MTYIQYTNIIKVSFSRLRYMDVYVVVFDFFIFCFPSKDAERQKPDKTPSEDLTDEVEEEQGEDIRSEKLNEYKEPKGD